MAVEYQTQALKQPNFYAQLSRFFSNLYCDIDPVQLQFRTLCVNPLVPRLFLAGCWFFGWNCGGEMRVIEIKAAISKQEGVLSTRFLLE